MKTFTIWASYTKRITNSKICITDLKNVKIPAKFCAALDNSPKTLYYLYVVFFVQ